MLFKTLSTEHWTLPVNKTTVATATFIGLWWQQSEDVIQPEPHHRCTRLQVSPMDLDDGGDTGKKQSIIRANKGKNLIENRCDYVLAAVLTETSWSLHIR